MGCEGVGSDGVRELERLVHPERSLLIEVPIGDPADKDERRVLVLPWRDVRAAGGEGIEDGRRQ
jgi:hypothetical protein